MNNLRDAIARLAPAQKARGRLPAPATREALPVSVSEAVPTGADAGTAQGIASPLTEVSQLFVTYSVFDIYDPTASIQFEEVVQSTFTDANGASIVIDWINNSGGV